MTDGWADVRERLAERTDRVDGTLRAGREVNDHPGVTRGVGPFDPDVLPETCRGRDRVLSTFGRE